MILDDIVASGSSVNAGVVLENDEMPNSNLQKPKKVKSPVKQVKNRAVQPKQKRTKTLQNQRKQKQTKKANGSKRKPRTTKPKKRSEPQEFVWCRFPRNCKAVKLNRFVFDESNTGPALPNDPKSPIEFFSLFLTDDLIDTIVTETNRYAEQTILVAIIDEELSQKSRLNDWTDVTPDEIRVFFGIMMWMGLDKKPSMNRYWSGSDLYSSPVRKYMSRNRFQAILAMLHLTNNLTADKTDKLHKLGPVLDYLNEKFQSLYVPGETVCIDESMMPWRGRLGFRQYIPSKRHKYGIKFFKLCLPHGYTYKFKIYVGAEDTTAPSNVDEQTGLPVGLSERVVLHLCDNILDTGRTLYTDNFYTSVTLAKSLLARKTHLVGTLRSNRKHNPKSVIKKKLVKGELNFFTTRISFRVGTYF